MKDLDFLQDVDRKLKHLFGVLELAAGRKAALDELSELREEVGRRLDRVQAGLSVSAEKSGNVCDECWSSGKISPAIAWAAPPMPTGAIGLCQTHLELESGSRALVWHVPGKFAARASAAGISLEELLPGGRELLRVSWPKSLGGSSERSRRGAFRRARSAWPLVTEARTFARAHEILAQAGVRLS